MKKLISIFILVLTVVLVRAQVPENIQTGFQTSNARLVSGSFAANVDLKILDKEDVYSKAQAEMILKDFFSKRPAKSFSVLHQGNSKNGARFTICRYESGTDTFRTYIYYKKGDDNKEYIQELRIEPDKK